MVRFAATAALIGILLLSRPGSAGPLDDESATDAETWKNQGLALLAQRRLDRALPAFSQACTVAPQDEDACYYLARTLYALDRWDEARPAFEQAMQAATKQKIARVHRAMALNYIALGNPADAEQHFRQAVVLNVGPGQIPEDPRIDFGTFLFRQGRVDEALPMLKDAARAAPKSARAHAELGRVLLDAGTAEQAARELQEAVRLDPNAWNVRLLFGRALLQLGRSGEGQKELEIAREGWKLAQGSSTVR